MKKVIFFVMVLILFRIHSTAQVPVDSTDRAIKSAIDAKYRLVIFDKYQNPDFVKLEKEAVKKYGEAGEEVFWNLKALYYYVAFGKSKRQSDLATWADIKIAFNKKYPNGIHQYDLNNDAWLIFENSTNKIHLEAALSWSKKAIEKEPTMNYYDTYANLLYKLGRKEEAVRIMEKGLTLPPGNIGEEGINNIKANFERMKREEKLH